ncbi:10988_t:CDS:2 [Rhizophagus irregularis]|nr:10988_t:CDS:2 [Rhizophagus irregularis]
MSSEKTSVQVVNLPTRFQKSVLSTAPYAPNQVIVAGEKKQYFSYDYVFGPDSTQKDVYDRAVLKLIDKFLEDPDDKGIIPRAVSTLFSSMESAQYKTRKFSIKVSFIEIYNEDLIDLLGEGDGESRPQVLIREDSKGNILWSGLQEIKVNSVEEVISSHAIFSVTLAQQKFISSGGSSPSPQPDQKSGVRPPSRSNSRLSRRFDEGEWVSVTSKFHFVDLAGSERLKRTSAVGERVKEGISINSGLLALGNVISALGDPNKAKHTTHIPYRDSKLTRLLQDSLGGNAQTLMIACVSPAEYNLVETVNTLKYANRARNIKNNATINAEEAGWNDVEHLQTLVMRLRNEIKILKAATGVINSNGTSTNGTTSGRTTPSLNGTTTPSLNGRTTPNLNGRTTPSLNGRETPSFTKRSSTPSFSDIELLEDQLQQLKRSYIKLSQRYAKTSAELAKHQDNDVNNNNSNVDTQFKEVVEPVIEEYEKSFTSLESELAITKAALSHSEIILQEQEGKLEFAEQNNEKNKNNIAELTSKIAKYVEMETSMERYIKNLEVKLENLTLEQIKDQELINEMKLEISQLKSNESNSEAYIEGLENKLYANEGHAAKLDETITKLEKRLRQRDLEYHELEERLRKAEVDEEKSLLLDDLNVRDKKIFILEQSLESLENELRELKNLNEQNFLNSKSKFNELQKTHEKTLQDFEDIKSKYQSCLLEIHELQNQLTEAKLIQSETIKSTPTTPMSPQTPDSFRLSLPPTILNRSNNSSTNALKHKRSKSFSTEIYGDKKDDAHLAVIRKLHNEIQQLSLLHEDKAQGLDAVKQEFARLEISYRETIDIVEELREELKRRDALAQLEVMSVMTYEHADGISYYSVNASEVDELDIVHRLREEVEHLKEEQRITMEALSEREKGFIKKNDEILRLESNIQELQEELHRTIEEPKDDKDVKEDQINELQSRVKELEQELIKAQEVQRTEQIDEATARLEGTTDSSKTDSLNDDEETLTLRRQVEKLQYDIESKSHTIATLLLPSDEHQNIIRRLEDELQEVREAQRQALKERHNRLSTISEDVIGEIEQTENNEISDNEHDETMIALEAEAKELETRLIKAKEAQHIPTPRSSYLHIIDPTKRDIEKLQEKLLDLQNELAHKSETIQDLQVEKELVSSLQSQLEILKDDIKRKYESIEILKKDLVDKGMLQQKLREKEAEANVLQSQLLTVKKHDSEMQDQMKVLQSQLLKLESGSDEGLILHTELENVRKELKESKENEKLAVERLRVLNAEESKLQQDLQRLRQENIVQEERINGLESQLIQEGHETDKDLAALKTELELVKESEVAQKQKISELENKLKDSETEVSSLQSKIVDMKSKSTENFEKIKEYENEVIQLKNTLNSNNSQYQQLVSEIENLRVLENEQKQYIETLENKLKQDEPAVISMKDELTKLKSTESQLISTIQELETKLTEAEKENEQIQVIKDEFNVLKELDEKQKSEIEQLNSQLKETQSAKDAAIEELKNMKEDFTAQKELVMTLESELKNVREEITKEKELNADNTKNLEDLSNMLNATKQQQDEEEKKKRSLEDEVETLKASGETNDKVVNELKTELTNLKLDMEARNKFLSEIENKINFTEKERDQHLERVNELTKMLETKEIEKKEAIFALENKVSDLQSQLEQVKESSMVDQKTVESLEEKLATLNSQLSDAKESDEKSAQKVSELEIKLKESNALLSEKEQSLSDKNAKYAELEAIIEKTRAEIESSKASEVEKNNQIKQLEIDLKEAKDNESQQIDLIHVLESQLQEVEKERDDHIPKIAEANSEIDILKEKCSTLQNEINELHRDSVLQSYSDVDENVVEELSNELKKVQEEAREQEERAATLQKKVNKLQSEKNDQLEINAVLAQQIEQLQKDLESLAEEFTETATKQEDNEIQMKERISELETALEAAKNSSVDNPSLANLAAANESLRQTNDDLNQKIVEAEHRASSLSEKVKELENENNKSSIDSLKAKIQELEDEKRVLEQVKESSLEERQKLDQQIESLMQQLQTSGRNGNKTASHLAELNAKILSLENEISQAKQKAKEDTSEIIKLSEINEKLEKELNGSQNTGDDPTQVKLFRQEATIAQQNNLIKSLQEKISELERQTEENSGRPITPNSADFDAVGGYRTNTSNNSVDLRKSAVRSLPLTPPPNQPLPRVPIANPPPSPGAPPSTPPPKIPIPLPPRPDSRAGSEEVEKLHKRIAKLEGDNSQNRQLVDTLEASLNDSEGNLRVAKKQLQVLQREKSDLVNQMKSLKMQLEDAAAQYEQAKSSVQQEKKVIENVLLEERRAKEQAEKSKRILESRMEELMAKKSKFMCF